MSCNRRQLFRSTSGRWRSTKHKYNCIHMGFSPFNKGEARSKSGEFEGAFGAVPRWPKKFIIHDVSGSARERAREGGLLRLSSSGKDNEVPSDYSQLHPHIASAATAADTGMRECVLWPFLKNGCRRDGHLRSLEARPFLRGQAINTRIICILLNGRHLRGAAFWTKPVERNALHSFRWGTCTPTHTGSIHGVTRTSSGSIVYSKEYFRCCTRLCPARSPDAMLYAHKTNARLYGPRLVLKYVTRYR